MKEWKSHSLYALGMDAQVDESNIIIFFPVYSEDWRQKIWMNSHQTDLKNTNLFHFLTERKSHMTICHNLHLSTCNMIKPQITLEFH